MTETKIADLIEALNAQGEITGTDGMWVFDDESYVEYTGEGFTAYHGGDPLTDAFVLVVGFLGDPDEEEDEASSWSV